MRRVREITAKEEGFRTEPMAPGMPNQRVVKRNGIEPEPVGTYVAMVFRVTGYDPDCDGSLMARFEQVDEQGRTTGWEPTHLGLYPNTDIVVESPAELFRLCDEAIE